MRNYLRDLLDSNDPKELFSLIMGVVSVIMLVRRFRAANQRVSEHRSNPPIEIS
jgi:hypothetical protein